ncbi:MAG TPA: imidazole glycerol phosphate synthase subunit HisH [Labilithrix sp.]|nr:imidazole glycerol phosphate synthase subunit HisH [Labilithrix sp.]
MTSDGMRIVALATGHGNVRSVVRALERATSDTGPREITPTNDAETVRRADVLVVPGQGAFGAFAAALDGGLRETVLEHIRAGKPYLGICLGLQILFEESDEAPGARGLGVLQGRVRRLVPGLDGELGRPLPLPHIGWNRTELVERAVTASDPLVVPAHYYFAHSYVVAPKETDVTLTVTSYGGETFASSVEKDNVAGVQFHPEKSQRAGASLLYRFFSGLGSRQAS